jgi:ribosome-associated protein
MSDVKSNPAPEPAKDQEKSTPAQETVMPDESSGWQLAERACWHLLEKKGEDLVVLDLRGRSDVCDFFVLASGSSDVQVRALAKNLQDHLLDVKQKPKGVEGLNEGRWALLDYFDVVVHIFREEARDYFQMERLWGDAGRLDIGPEWFADAAVKLRHPDLKFHTGADAGAQD